VILALFTRDARTVLLLTVLVMVEVSRYLAKLSDRSPDILVPQLDPPLVSGISLESPYALPGCGFNGKPLSCTLPPEATSAGSLLPIH